MHSLSFVVKMAYFFVFNALLSEKMRESLYELETKTAKMQRQY
jgi:hypothetical protein